MSDLTSQDLYQRLTNQSRTAAFNPNKFDELTAATNNKLTEIARANQEKLASLQSFQDSVAARNTLTGQALGLGIDSDLSREFVENTISGTGSVIKGVGKLGSMVGLGEGELANQANDYLSGLAGEVDNLQTVGFRNDMLNSTPEGDIFDPSSWSLGDDPSITGGLGQLAAMAGQFTPQLLGMVLTRGASLAVTTATTGAIGGLQAGGGASSEVEGLLAGLDESGMAEASRYYGDLRKEGTSHDEAKKEVIDTASSAAFLGAAPVGAVGGAATAYVLGPLQKKLSGNLLGRITKSVGISGLEEGTQEVAESISAKTASNVAIGGNQDVTEGSFGNFVLGAGLGGSLGAPAAIKDTYDSTKELITKNIANAEEQDAAFKEAVATGDVSAFLDPDDKESFNPGVAAGALDQIITNPDSTPEEVAEARESQKGIISFISEEAAALEKRVEILKQSTDKKKTAKILKEAEDELNLYQKQLDIVEQFNDKTVTTEIKDIVPEDVVADVKAKKEGSVDKLMTLAMADPESLSSEQALELVKDTNNGLSSNQRNFLRTYSDAQIERNKLNGMDGVSNDIYKGGVGYKGLGQYQKGMATAVNTGNPVKARKELEGITAFVDSRESKLGVIKDLFNKAQQTNKTYQVAPTDGGVWEYLPEPVSKRELEKAGGLEVHKNSNSTGLIDRIEQETKTLKATQAQMQASYDVAFGTSPVQEPVNETTQTETVTEAPSTPEPVVATPTEETGTQEETTGQVEGKLVPNPVGEHPADVVEQAVLENNTTKKLTQWVADKSTNGSYRAIAKRILDNVEDKKVLTTNTIPEQVDSILAEWGIGAADGDYMILRAPNHAVNGYHGMTEETVLHELLHMVTVKTINKVLAGKGSPHEKAAVKALDNLHKEVLKHLKDDTDDKVKYGISDLHEFISVGLTHPVFQGRLKDIQLDGGSAWTQFVKAIADLLGLGKGQHTALSELLLVTENLISPEGTKQAARKTDEELQSVIDNDPATNEDEISTEAVEAYLELEDRKDAETVEAQPETVAVDSKVIKEQERAKSDPREVNRVKAFFTQRKGKVSDKTAQALVLEEDFITKVDEDNTVLDKYVEFSNDPSMAEKQTMLFNKFSDYAKEWSKRIPKNIAKNDPRFNYKDPIRFFLEDGDLPENVKTALSYSAFNYVAENGLSNPITTLKDINKLLNRDEKQKLSADERILQSAGTLEKLVINTLGKAATQALGLKADKDAPMNDIARLEGSLGTHALALLLQDGLVERVDVAGSVFANKDTKEKEATRGFIRFKRDWNKDGVAGELNFDVESIGLVTQGTGGFLSNVFKAEPGKKEPSFEPVDKVQKFAKGTRQLVSKVQTKILSKVGQQGNYLRKDMVQVFDTLSDTTLQKIVGVVDPESTFIHKANRMGVDGKNRGLNQELNYMREFIDQVRAQEGGMDTPFYFPRSVWKMFRVGLDTNTINPQTSKIHRHMMAMGGWETEVKLDDETSVNNFKLAVADAFFDTDKQTNKESLAELDDFLNQPDTQAAIDSLSKSLTGEIGVDQDLIAKVIGGKGFHGLDALVAMANFELAKGKPSFKTSIMREVDGVTNGPMLTLLQLGADPNRESFLKTLNKGGFYTDEDVAQQYTEWKSQSGNEDLYQSVAFDVVKELRSQYDSNPGDQAAIEATFHFLGRFTDEEGNVVGAGRSAVKTPLTGFAFGSGINTAVKNMGFDIIDAFYEKIEEAANTNNFDLMNNTFKELNVLLGSGNQIKTPITFKEALEATLSARQEEAIIIGFSQSTGKAIKNVMEDRFEPLIKTRNLLNRSAKTSFALYDIAYKAARQAYVDKLEDKTVDLTTEQEQEVRAQVKALEPIVHTPFSKMSNQLDAGLNMSKLVNNISDNPIYESQSKFGVRIPKNNGKSGKDGSIANIKARAMVATETDPGVSAVIMLIHSLDSAISSLSYDMLEALNVHDAHGLGLKDVHKGAQNLNKQTFELLRDFDLSLEVSDALARSIKAFTAFNKANPELSTELNKGYGLLKKDIVKSMKRDNPEVLNGDPIRESFKAIRNEAVDSSLRKLDVMRDFTSVDQYALEGGSYKVTDADRFLVEERILEVTKKRTETLSSESIKQESDWGKVGNPNVAPDYELVRLLESTPNMTIGKLIPLLGHRIKNTQNGRMRAFNLALLTQLKNTTNRDTKVELITPNSPVYGEAGNVQTARGWYTVSKNGEVIRIKSPDFVHSGLTPELLLHELTHASVAQAIDKPTEKTKPFIAELYTLRHKAAEYVKDKPELAKKFENALSDIQELVAWGMTNEDFQRDVLTKIQMENRTVGLLTGMQSFVRNIIGLLFPSTKHSEKVKLENGMSILVTNTAGLFANVDKGNNELLLKQESNSALNYTTQQIFDALKSTSTTSDSAFNTHLNELMNDVVDKVHGAYGANKLEVQPAYTTLETYIKSVRTGRRPFASRATNLLNMEKHEAFVLEQIELSVKTAAEGSHSIYRELTGLYKEAKDALKNVPFDSDPVKSKEMYDFIFKPNINDEGKSDYLSRFAAMGVAYKPLYTKLQQINTNMDTTRLVDMKLGEAIKYLVKRALDVLNGKFLGAYAGQRADIKLKILIDGLVDIEAKKQAAIEQERVYEPNKLEEAIHNASEGLRNTVKNAASADVIRDSGSKIVRALGGITATIAGDRSEQMLDTFEKIRNSNFQSRQGVMSGLLTEARGANDSNLMFHELLRVANAHEQERKHLIDETASLIKGSFRNEGKDLTREQKEAITRTLVRTDLSSLLGKYSMVDIASLVLDTRALGQAIKNQEAELSSSANKHYYIKSAKDLGYHLATGETVGRNLMLNAHNIAYMANTRRKIQGNNIHAESAMPVIDTLATLYALKYLPPNILAIAQDTVRSEMQRGSESGVELILKVHKGLQKDALAANFDNNPVHFIKGYTKEILNPRKEVVVANDRDGAQLIAMGYVKKGSVSHDTLADTDRSPKSIYVMSDGGLRAHVTGIFSYKGEGTKGSKLHGGVTNLLSNNPSHYNQNKNTEVARRTSTAINDMFRADANYDPRKVKGSKLVPVLNLNGDVSNYRYMMKDETKDELLQRNNEVDLVLGNMAGSTYDKAVTPEQNKVAVQALYDQYLEEFTIKPEAYITLSPDSTDPAIRETYKLLPDETKKEIKRIWGKHEMKVRTDLYDINFGYRKYSLADIWDKDAVERNIMETMFYGLVDLLFDQKAALRIRQAEDAMQEMVRLTKDILVIKNLFTLLGNISSNVTLLLWMGVSPTSIVKQHTTAIKGLLNYQRDRKELNKLKTLIEVNALQGQTLSEMNARIVELEDAISRNPVKELIDAGLFQTIVEDVDNEDDKFSYTSRLSDLAEKHTQWLPEGVKTVGKTLLMTHDTPLYKLLSQTTSMSDFVARYTLHEHMVNRKNEPMGKDESIQLAVDAFVNYDIPSHQKVQYLNDLGILWFTKYYIRIQKVILHLYRDNPGRSLAMITLANMFPSLPTLVDSGAWNHLGNPINEGALKLPESVDEIAALKLALSPFN